MPVKLVSAGGGAVTLDVPNTGSNFNMQVPARAATLLADDGSGKARKADMPSGSIIGAEAYAFTSRVALGHVGWTTYLSGTFTKSRADSRLMIMLQLSGRSDANGATASRFNIGSSTAWGGSKYTPNTHSDIVNQIFDVSNNTQTGALSWSYQQTYNTFAVLNPTSSDDGRIENSTSRVFIIEVMA